MLTPTRHDAELPPLPTTCPACGKPFLPGQWLTIAAWFTAPGTPRDTDIVHAKKRCANARRPK